MLCYTLTCRVCHLAGEFAKMLKEHIDDIPSVENYRFETEEVLCAKIAGLCHDLGALLTVQLMCDINSCSYRTWSLLSYV